VRAFFGRARELETVAKGMLESAAATKPPTNGAEDANLQRQIQIANGHVKAVAEHWSICQVLSRFHKRTTAARARATDPAERASQILNGLHQRFVEDARRREAMEAERLRVEAETRARADRERELAALEAAALKAEQDSPELSEREEMFVDSVVAGKSSFVAASQAGYSQPRSAAERLLKSAKVQQAIKAREDAVRARQQAAAVREAPVQVEATTTLVQSEVQKVGSERTTKSAEIVDATAFVEAAFSGQYGIPHDTVAPVQAILNGYAKSLGPLIAKWPGIKFKSETKVY